jgi:hypothetical protein
MKKKRALPFGYTVEDGKLKIEEQEASVIRKIFDEYISGTSMGTLAELLTARQIPYCDRRTDWNKSVIARILNNEKYVGENGFDPIIDLEEYREALACKDQRMKKQLTRDDDSDIGIIRTRMVCPVCKRGMNRVYEKRNREPEEWQCSNAECGYKIKLADALLICRITERLNLLIENPDLIGQEKDESPNDSLADRRGYSEISRLCENGADNERILNTILTMVSERYQETQKDMRDDTAELRKLFSSHKAQQGFDRELFIQSVDSVSITDSGSIVLKLKNGTEL